MSASNCSNQAWVTLATNDSYSLGALVLAQSLRRSGTTRRLVVMVTDEVSSPMMDLLADAFDFVINVKALDSMDVANLSLLERPELGITFTKLHCWKLTQFTKCVFLDADTMVVQNSDELFDRDELSAAPDAGWPDCFNSGVFVFVPSEDKFKALMEHARQEGSFDGGDQGLLNTFFSDWAYSDIRKHLPFLYNMVATASYTYLPAYKKYGDRVKIVHFIGSSKPWHATFDQEGQPLPQNPEDRHAVEHLKHWWSLYQSDVRHRMRSQPSGAQGGAGSAHGVGGGAHAGPSTSASVQPDNEALKKFGERMQKQAWEAGRPDYMGRSSMEKIIEKIDSAISSPKSE